MSLVSQIILEADDELRYLTICELENIQDYLKTGLNRIEIISKIKSKERDIIRTASKQLFQIHPDYIAPGGNASGNKERSLCLRDYGWYLRLITYGILAGDKEPIERIGLVGVKEMYNSLGVPIIGMIDSIDCLKKATLSYFSSEESSIIEPYFDYIIRSMSI
uniref:Allophycocyanin gamma subunit n=1 Tax=Bangiopsis subsimplex TaxID=139980 RepID=A0A1C9CCN8_9RHOD|nr:allophycocyanin gamma subunit [Bangiopsis subsimplex]AOM66127.1 allophycocyanin gamma subunit [Bangiopsis subsimplex]ARO90316.1 allophycocyanin gamma subunit [Bangiopsis subsimplex]